MNFKVTIVLSVVVVVLSCGPSQREIEIQEKHVADSIRVVDSLEFIDSVRIADSISLVKEQQLELERIHKEKIEVGKSILKTKLTNILEDFEQQLVSAKRKLNRINEFEFGRSRSTKDRQLSEQNERIDQIKSHIARVEKEIALSNLFQSFDFQETPLGTVEHLFSSAKSRDFSKVRHLLDPYGEYDGDALRICLVEMSPRNEQEIWQHNLENGRIMSEPTIVENNAQLEVAIGPSSSRLEKINLVRRMDKWYLRGM